jgi:CHAT domain-containing protein
LIEDYALVISPSASLLVACSHAASDRTDAAESLLSVALSQFDQSRDARLADLPSAAKEASAIATCYLSPRVLLDERASKRAVLREMKRASVIHIASHAISDSSPMESRLLLAKEVASRSGNESSSPNLLASDVYRLRLPKARLVVLSACRTGMERYYRGEGSVSLTRAFLAAGVPLVVASLWSVESTSTMELMIRFHQYRKVLGRPSAESLRLAQTDMLTIEGGRYRHPYYWAPFNLVGGYATY